MLRWIVGSTLKFRRLIVAAAVGVMVIGIAQLGKTPVDVLPEFNPPMVEVQTEALGLSAEEVEQLITVPLEQDLLVGVPFLDEIESVSLPGLSSVVMTFEPGTELLDARQVVQERLTQAVGIAGLPAVAKLPQMIQPLSSQSRVAMIKLTSDQLSLIEQSVLARWVIGPRLMSTPGVANAYVWGNRDQQLQVQVDPERLQQNDVTLDQVIRTAGNALEVSPLSFLQASSPGTGGFLDTPNQRLNIFHEQAISNPGELAQVPLEGVDPNAPKAGPPVALGDVTDVVEDHQPLIGDAVCRGGEDCLLMVVEKFPGANVVEVEEGIQEALDALRPGLADMQMDSSIYNPASYVESSYGSLGWGLLAAGLLLLLVLGAFVWDWRRLLIGVAAVAASAGAALVVLQLRGTTVNLMVVAGLLVGLTAMIHDAVSDIEGPATRRDTETTNGSVWKSIADSAAEMRRSITYAILIAAAATLPVFFMQAEGGAFLPPIALSYLLAVVASMLVALTLTPALAAILLIKAAPGAPESPLAGLLRRGYDRVAPKVISRTGVAFGVALGIAVVGVVALPFTDTSLRPSIKESEVLVHVQASPGTSLTAMSDSTGQMVDELGSLPGVANVGSHVGRAVMSDESVNVNSGEIWVNLDEAADHDATVDSIESTVAGQSGIEAEVLTYSEERVTDVLGRASDDLVVRVYGENADVLDGKANELKALVAGIDGVARAEVDRVPTQPTLEVQVDIQKAKAFGVKPGDVRRTAASLLGGITVGNLFDQQKVFDVVVWGDPAIRDSAADVENLLVDTPDGGQVRLGDVSDVSIVPNPTQIRHESVASYVDVTAQVADGSDVGAVADEIDKRIKQVSFPLDHHAEVLGGYAEQAASQTRVAGAALAGAVAVFLLMQAAFGSWRLATLAFLSLPVSLVGGLAAALLTGGTLSLGSLAGFLAVLGIAARGVVVLIRRYQRLERREGASFGDDVVLQGTRESLLPIVVAALATAVVFVPIAVVGSITGFGMLLDMMAVVIGGLVTATVVNLFVVPVLYRRYGYVSDPDLWSEELYRELPEPAPAQPGVAGRMMKRVRAMVPVIPVAIAGLLLSSCGGAVEADSYVIEHDPAKIVTVPGSDIPRVVVEEAAAKRLGIQTTPAKKTSDGVVVPSSAVFVDPEGEWWVYKSPDPLLVGDKVSKDARVFVRDKIQVERQEGRQTFISGGLAPGTEVVTVGLAEVGGIEAEIAS